MSQTKGPTAAVGVQELIDRIRGQGVQAARDEADRILAEARQTAASVKAKAETDARGMLDAARTQIAAEKTAANEAIRNAARDALLELRDHVRQAFEVHVRQLVSHQAQDTGFIRSLVLVLAGQAADKFITDQDAVIFVSSAMAGGVDTTVPQGAVRDKIHNAVLGATGQLLREGIELSLDNNIKGGVRVKLVGQDLEIDMTDEALSRLLLKNLMPRYLAIIKEGQAVR